MAAAPQLSAVVRACDEAETALKLFLQGKFDEAERFVEERVEARDRVAGAIPIFTHCHAVVLFAKAGITGTEEDRVQAMERLQEATSLASEHIPKQRWVQSIAAWGMGYFTSPSPKLEDIPEEELTCRIIEAEATYLSAILCFFEESIASFFKAALLIRKAISGYKHCHGIIQRQQRANRSEHDVGAVRLGFGGFSLALSLLPPKLLRLLSVLGFPCDRAAGLCAIEQSLQGGGLRASVAGMLLLSYHVILPSFFSIPQEREQHVIEAQRMLSILDKQYPGSFFLGFYRGRLQRLKKDLVGSMAFFSDLDQGLVLSSESKFFKLRHAWVYELGLGNMLQLKWKEAEKYWVELEEDSVWSRAFFSFLHGVCLSMRGEAESAATKFAKVQRLMRGAISGRILAEEQYASRMVKDHRLDSTEGVKSLQGRISGLTFLYLWNSFPQMPQQELECIVKIIDSAEASAGNPFDSDDKTEGPSHSSQHPRDADAQVLPLSEAGRPDSLSRQPSGTGGSVTQDWLQVFEDPYDDEAVCSLIKGTALRELGKLDEALECLDFIREDSCYVENELFVFPMAAYERALLFIMQYSKRAEKNSDQAANYDLLLKANKELELAEGFKRDYNFLWRLLGRVHAARGAIQQLMGEEKKIVVDSSMAEGEGRSDEKEDFGCNHIKLMEASEQENGKEDVFFDAL